MTLGEVEEPLGCLEYCWLRCYKTVDQTKRGETHIHQQLVFLGGLGFTKGVFSKFRIIRPQSVGVDHGASLVHGGLQSPYVPIVVCGKFCPTAVPTPLQINSQKGELSIRKMEVQVENFDTLVHRDPFLNFSPLHFEAKTNHKKIFAQKQT